MAAQMKKIAFLAPRAGLSREQFVRYWRETHGPLVAGSPGYGAYRQKYVQNHFVGAGPVGGAFHYAGMAEFWLPADNEDIFATTPIYRERIRIDEMNFIDMDDTVSMTAVEDIVRQGTGAVKLVAIRRDNAAAAGNAFSRTEGALRVVLNRVLKDSFRLPGSRPVQGTIDCIQELWFDSETEAQKAVASLANQQGWPFLLRNMCSSKMAGRYAAIRGECTRSKAILDVGHDDC